ncbi:hypothetical protein [Nocardia sp. NPDC052566]|uniref:hypothetical protein n=1 Tax=Nocardia sp. NPDC052566 TaxID=3364330 RepID=UPI0037C79163
MPHVEIWHYPRELSEDAARRLESAIVDAITQAFEVTDGAVSIGLETVDPARWTEDVYRPLITERAAETTLLRTPGY